jgi:hypothetical protein
VQNESLTEKYLGIPTEVGSSNNSSFKYLKDPYGNNTRMDGADFII